MPPMLSHTAAKSMFLLPTFVLSDTMEIKKES